MKFKQYIDSETEDIYIKIIECMFLNLKENKLIIKDISFEDELDIYINNAPLMVS